MLINKISIQIALVVEIEELVGTVTDGDIRRAILRGESLDTSVKNIMQKKYVFLREYDTEIKALGIMSKNFLRYVPVIDSKRRLINLFTQEEFAKPKFLSNEVIIMAGGKGTRLGELTKNNPKPMVKINGTPILQIILEQCILAGFKKFYFSVNYLKDKIKDYFKDGSRWNISINYLEEDKPLGTVGSLSLLRNRPYNPIIVLNCDILTKINFDNLIKFHKENSADISICVSRNITNIPYGVVDIDNGQVSGLREKPNLINFVNAGVYLLEPKIIDLISKDTPLDINELFNLAKEKKYKIIPFPIHEYWQDIGHLENLHQTSKTWV